jgi:hypothetical protein
MAVQTGKMYAFLPLVMVPVFTRSNGGMITIVPIYFTAHKIARNLWGTDTIKFLDKKPESKAENSTFYNFFAYIFGSIFSMVKGIKYFVIYLFLVIVGFVLPISLAGMWKPYEMYCVSRLDTYLEVPSWCMKTVPDVYSFIQKLYWDVGFLRFMERPWYLFATSLFTSTLFLYIARRLVRDQGLLSLFTFGISRTYEKQT